MIVPLLPLSSRERRVGVFMKSVSAKYVGEYEQDVDFKLDLKMPGSRHEARHATDEGFLQPRQPLLTGWVGHCSHMIQRDISEATTVRVYGSQGFGL